MRKQKPSSAKTKTSKKGGVGNHHVYENVARGFGTGAGVRRKIESPEQLHDFFVEYAIWSKDHPYKLHVATSKSKKIYQDKERVLTFIGFEGWLCERRIIYDLSYYEREENYSPIIKEIKKICSNDTVTGASAGIYNANLASRLEKLEDRAIVNLQDERKRVADLFPTELDEDDEEEKKE